MEPCRDSTPAGPTCPSPRTARSRRGPSPRSSPDARHRPRLTSPLARAVRTAELAGRDRDVIDPDLHEWDYGGTRASRPARSTAPGPTGTCGPTGCRTVRPGTPASRPRRWAGARTASGPCRATLLGPDGATSSSSAHGHFLRVLTARRLGLPPAAGWLFQLATGTVSRLGTEHGRPVIKAWNTTGARPTAAASLSGAIPRQRRPAPTRPRVGDACRPPRPDGAGRPDAAPPAPPRRAAHETHEDAGALPFVR